MCERKLKKHYTDIISVFISIIVPVFAYINNYVTLSGYMEIFKIVVLFFGTLIILKAPFYARNYLNKMLKSPQRRWFVSSRPSIAPDDIEVKKEFGILWKCEKYINKSTQKADWYVRDDPLCPECKSELKYREDIRYFLVLKKEKWECPQCQCLYDYPYLEKPSEDVEKSLNQIS